MIIGDKREQVIENIKNSAKRGTFYDKVELNDPELSEEEKQAVLKRYLRHRRTPQYYLKNLVARQMANLVTWKVNRTTKIIGIENMKLIHGGAIVTSNHFSPFDNTVIRDFALKFGKRKLYIVAQETNLAMKGILGFLMNYADVIPISNDHNYMTTAFIKILWRKLHRGQFILIYPEQEMWFHYRKPRPPKRGAYYYAAKLNVPIISCFIEMRNAAELDNNENFYKVEYVLHILPPIFPNPEKSVRDNSLLMQEADYRQKKQAYEEAYGKPLTYDFDAEDIAGWIAPQSN